MRLPLVSVIIPFYKGKEWLIEALESVVSQKYPNLEIILINDGSREDISDVITLYKKWIVYYFQENKGAAAARNKGIEISKGDYIAFLDSDDIWNVKKIHTQIRQMERTKAMWSHTNYETFDKIGNKKYINTSEFKGDVFPISIISNPIATPSVVINREVFIKNPNIKFPEHIYYGEDTILWMLISLKYDLLSINENLLKVRIRGTNSSKLITHQINGRASIWRWIKIHEPFSIKDKVKKRIRYSYLYCILLDNFINKIKVTKTEIVILKILYLLPWGIFKLERLFFLKKKVKI